MNPALPRPPAGLLLDLDGTLVDTEMLHLESTNVVLAELGRRLEVADYLGLIGTAEIAFWEEVAARFALEPSPSELARRRNAAHLEVLGRTAIVPLPGVADLLARAARAGIPVAVASAAPRDQVGASLRAAGLLPFVAAYFSSHDDVPRGKPHPDVYEAAAAAIGALPSRCVAVEDSHIGVQAARAAGAFVVAVPCQSHPDAHLDRAHLRLKTLSALPPLLGI